jgi:hypothetical protein
MTSNNKFCTAELMFDPKFGHHIYFIFVIVTLHTEKKLSNLPGSYLKVPVGGGL